MEKKKMMIIDGTPVQIEEERNIVELACKIGSLDRKSVV